MEDLYNSIFTRRSMRRFDSESPLTGGELDSILAMADETVPLAAGIETMFVLTEEKLKNVRFGERSILFYSKKDGKSLLNAGYRIEQLDLWLAGKHFGSCWYGLTRPVRRAPKDFSFVIQLAIGRPADPYRSGAQDFSRKPLSEIWEGEFNPDVKEAFRLSPSACNTQPWKVKSSEKEIRVYRNTKVRSIIPAPMRVFFNSIDLGISLCHLETALNHFGTRFSRRFADPAEPAEDGLVPIASYSIL